MEKVIGGKTYVEVPELTKYGCVGCAAKSFDGSIGPLCRALGDDCSTNKTIWKEQTMSEQKEKTALELVDELDQYLTQGPLGCHDPTATSLTKLIKAAIERDQASAITMRPISELPDRVPDGCMVVVVSATCLWPFGNSELIKNLRYVAENFKASRPTHFYILPLPKPERRLHPCYMPGCGGSVIAINGVEKTDWRITCTKCGMLGPIFNTKEKAELEWGHEE